MDEFPGRGEKAKTVGKLKQFVDSTGKFSSTSFENYCWEINWAFRYRGVDLEKDSSDSLLGERDG